MVETLSQSFKRTRSLKTEISNGNLKNFLRHWSRADLRSICRFFYRATSRDAQIQKKGKKRKTNILYKNRKLPSVTLFRKLSTESENINAVNRTKNYHSILIFLCFRHYSRSAPVRKTFNKQLQEILTIKFV